MKKLILVGVAIFTAKKIIDLANEQKSILKINVDDNFINCLMNDTKLISRLLK